VAEWKERGEEGPCPSCYVVWRFLRDMDLSWPVEVWPRLPDLGRDRDLHKDCRRHGGSSLTRTLEASTGGQGEGIRDRHNPPGAGIGSGEARVEE
jgi:hypothetical protein